MYQGVNPVLGLTVINNMEQPNGQFVPITYYDDGTGKKILKYLKFAFAVLLLVNYHRL